MIDKSNKKFWDKFAKQYAHYMKKDKEVYDKVCEYLSPHLNKDMQVLELACGVRPFLSDKFDVTKYKNYKLLEDYDKKNLFDVEEYLANRDKVKLKSSYKINRLNI